MTPEEFQALVPESDLPAEERAALYCRKLWETAASRSSPAKTAYEHGTDLLARPGRHEIAARMRDAGLTYREIGEHFSVTRERARQMVLRGYERRRMLPELEFDPIPTLDVRKARRLKATLDTLYPPPPSFLRRLFPHLVHSRAVPAKSPTA